jgi:hypothetical protein
LLLLVSLSVKAQDFGSTDKYVPPTDSPFDLTGIKSSNYSVSKPLENYGNFIKFNLFNPLRGIYAIEYERKVFDFLSVEAGFGLTLYPDYFKRSWRDEEDPFSVIMTKRGAHFHMGTRVYFDDVFDGSWLGFCARYTNYPLEFTSNKNKFNERYADYLLSYGFSTIVGNAFANEFGMSIGMRRFDAATEERTQVYDKNTGATIDAYILKPYVEWGWMFLLHYKLGIAF